MQFVRSAVERTGIREGNPAKAPFFEEDEVKRNIDRLQNNYGVNASEESQKAKLRSQAISSRMARATVHNETSGSGMYVIHEINAAYTLYEQSIRASDSEVQDSVEVLMAAYGMCVEKMQSQKRI